MAVAVNEIIVRVEKLKGNMVLARDVVLKSGYVLITRDTMLNDILIKKLSEIGIKSVVVKSTNQTSTMPRAEHRLKSTTQTGASHRAEHKPKLPTRTGAVKRVEHKPKSTAHRDEHKPKLPTQQRVEFKAFEAVHKKKETEVISSLRSISNGGVINMKQLYEITDGAMNAIESKNDIFSYLSFLKLKDDHTFSHSLNVSMLCNLFGRWLGLPSNELLDLTVAGLLHDIGKTKVDLSILNKPGKFTDEEYEIMKKHTIYGYKIVKPNKMNEEIKKAVLMHHERMNGSGYPLGLKGLAIGKYARIVAICDIYDAMTATRVYRKKICPFDVIGMFESSMYGELDPEYLMMFLKNIAFTYMSSNVILSDNRIAEVVFINTSNLSKPLVRVGDQFVDLSKEKNIKISMLR